MPIPSDFMAQHPEWVPKDNAMGYMSDNNGQDYNLCHCESLNRHLHRRTECDTPSLE